ncbi:P-loop containing nucleoside triphosphate hydrolase protein [Gymnopus androsaceus JB14]|uniref:DNA 3'-5' helicase n=1 Tax=Gymnopus androsaceus JB14 TaxID=1447944 RepID=A0A6A4GVF6_9AGAR|nr:P-loop containing nucleoside triphosphate hydrolase protein [Gymnopus androsaceus JB14]
MEEVLLGADSDLDSLDEDVTKKFHHNFVLKDFQKAATAAQLQRKDAMVHAHTGAGKTAIVAAPHAHPASEGKVTFLVSPLIALQDEQAEAFQNEYHLSAIAINSSHGGLTPKNMMEICSGKYQVVIISPEMMLTQRFTKNVIKNKELVGRVLSIVIDEAHVISHWGSGFRKKYSELGILRTLLPEGVPFVALSATLPRRVRNDILSKLRFSLKEEGYVNINIGNDRPNVSLVVWAIQHPMNTYKDLDFIVPDGVQSTTEIPKTFVYSDSLPSGPEIVEHLEAQLPKHLQGRGLVRPFSAVFSKKYRRALMRKFKDGSVRILVCTDAAGMGCNIPDVDVVVQWKLPKTLSMFVQRAGRAARAHGRKGLAVLLVEKSAYSLNCEELVSELQGESKGKKTKPKGRGKAKGKDKQPAQQEHTTGEYAKSTEKDFTQSRGVKRGSCDRKSDEHPKVGWEPRIDCRAKNEGLLAFVQTGSCRRNILTTVYENATPVPAEGVECCDMCKPQLLDRTRPGSYKAPPRPAAIPKGIPHKPTQRALYTWRSKIRQSNHSLALWPAQSILSNDHVKLLASVGPISSFEHLKKIIADQWGWWENYGENLWETIQGLDMPAMVPLPKTTKRKTVEYTAEGTESAPPTKRPRASSSGCGIEQEMSTMSTASVQRSQPHGASNLLLASRHLPAAISAPPTTPADVQKHVVYHPQEIQYDPATHSHRQQTAHRAHSMIPASTPNHHGYDCTMHPDMQTYHTPGPSFLPPNQYPSPITPSQPRHSHSQYDSNLMQHMSTHRARNPYPAIDPCYPATPSPSNNLRFFPTPSDMPQGTSHQGYQYSPTSIPPPGDPYYHFTYQNLPNYTQENQFW